MCGFPGVADVNVYGVEVPGAEGRVGMAAIKLKGSVRVGDFDWQVGRCPYPGTGAGRSCMDCTDPRLL